MMCVRFLFPSYRQEDQARPFRSEALKSATRSIVLFPLLHLSISLLRPLTRILWTMSTI